MSKSWYTPRLIVRRFVVTDWQDLFALQGDPIATRFVGGIWSEEKTRDTVQAIIGRYETTELEWLAVAERGEPGRVIGVCWLGRLAPRWCAALGWEPSPIELGYRYACAHWGRGYATEAAQTMIRRGFDELGAERLVAIVNIENAASERVLQKLGLTHSATGSTDGITIHGYTLDREVRTRPSNLTAL